jgi:hypothetical protein
MIDVWRLASGDALRQAMPSPSLDPIPCDPLSKPHQPQLGISPFRQRLPWWEADLQKLRDTICSQRLPEDLSTALTIDLGVLMHCWHVSPCRRRKRPGPWWC